MSQHGRNFRDHSGALDLIDNTPVSKCQLAHAVLPMDVKLSPFHLSWNANSLFDNNAIVTFLENSLQQRNMQFLEGYIAHFLAF